MAQNNKNIEDLFKNSFEDYSVSPPKSIWTKINNNLLFKRFFKFNPFQLNIYYSFLIVGITSLFIYNNKSINNNIAKENTIKIENTEKITKTKNTSINLTKDKKTNSTQSINKKENLSNKLQNKQKKDTEKKLTQTNEVINSQNITNKYAKEISDDGNEKIFKLAKPIANFSASTYEACEPATVFFTNASENSKRFLWNFGNDSTSTETNPSFVYKTAGTYTVTLTVYSGSDFETMSKEIVINKKPKSDFLISEKSNAFKDDELKFANLSENFTSCKWNFGDDNTSNFTHPTHTYTNAGIYTVSLICFSDKKCSDTAFFNNLKIKDEKYKISAPTALNPSMNGTTSGYTRNISQLNTVFKPKFNYEAAEYSLRIFNRFGSLVFKSNDPNFGWNGYYNNKVAPVDVYIWECSGKFSDGEVFIKTGNITVIHTK